MSLFFLCLYVATLISSDNFENTCSRSLFTVYKCGWCTLYQKNQCLTHGSDLTKRNTLCLKAVCLLAFSWESNKAQGSETTTCLFEQVCKCWACKCPTRGTYTWWLCIFGAVFKYFIVVYLGIRVLGVGMQCTPWQKVTCNLYNIKGF